MGAAFAAAEFFSLWVWIHTWSRALRRVHIFKPLTFCCSCRVVHLHWKSGLSVKTETLRTTVTPLNPRAARAGFVMPLLWFSSMNQSYLGCISDKQYSLQLFFNFTFFFLTALFVRLLFLFLFLLSFFLFSFIFLSQTGTTTVLLRHLLQISFFLHPWFDFWLLLCV